MKSAERSTSHRSLSDYFVGFLQTDPLHAGIAAGTLSAEASTHGTFSGPPGALPDQSFPYDDKYPGARTLRKRINFFRSCAEQDGGARRSRTDGLLNANQALSQLSYGPDPVRLDPATPNWMQASMVGRGRVELPTSRLSGVRSNHLSYRPEPGWPKPPQPSRRQATGARGARKTTRPDGQVNERRKRNEDGVIAAYCFVFPKKDYVLGQQSFA